MRKRPRVIEEDGVVPARTNSDSLQIWSESEFVRGEDLVERAMQRFVTDPSANVIVGDLPESYVSNFAH